LLPVVGGLLLAVSVSAHAPTETPPPQTPPQQPATPAGQQPTFRSTVDLVQVDVVVVDADGNPIRGLKAEDFALLDRRKPQKVATFEEISHETAQDAEPPPVFPPTLKMDVASNRSAQSDRLVVFVVDDLHIYQGRTDKAKDLGKQIINSLGPKASMAVIFTSGNNSTNVTEDRSELLKAMDTLKGRQSFRRPHQAIDKQVGQISQPESRGGDTDMSPVHKAIDAYQQQSLQDFEENLIQFKTLQDAARLIGADDARRKAFVVLTEGIGKDMTGMFESDMTPCEVTCQTCPCFHDRALREMMESMRRSSVATYNIDPRGHVTAQQLALEAFPSTVTGLGDDPATGGFRWDNPIRQAQDGLGIMAAASGGFAVTDTDDYATGLKQIIEDIDHYYLLGFYPIDTGGNIYRPLNVTVPNHPEWTLRFRKGYMPGGPPPPPKNADPLVALSAGVMPKTDLPLRLTAIPLPGVPTSAGSKTTAAGRLARVVAALEVTAPTKSMLEADSKLRDEVTYELLVIDDKKSKVTQRTGKAARLVMRGREGLADMPDLVIYQVENTLELPPGRYDIRASALSTKLGKGGSVYFTVDVPDFTSAPLMISGLAVGYADGAHVPVGQSATATRVVPFDIALDREFTSFDIVRLYCELARANVAMPVKVAVDLVDQRDAVRLHADRDVKPGDNGHLDVELRLNGIDAGPYRLRVTATSGAATTQREIGLVVR
jgi:VWFA-related protein